MKKILCMMLVLSMCLGLLCGCGNHTVIDLVFSYDYAIIELPNGEIVEGAVQQWSDYEGDQIQITIDGKVYLTHVSNAVLIADY